MAAGPSVQLSAVSSASGVSGIAAEGRDSWFM